MDIDFSPALIWFLVGLALALSEIFLPGIILVFFGAGAWIVALTTWWGWTDSLASQLAVFTVASLILLVALRRAIRNRFLGHTTNTEDGSANLDEFTGATVKVLTDISPDGGDGSVEFKGASWKARSRDTLAEGERAEVITADGIVLEVRRIQREDMS